MKKKNCKACGENLALRALRCPKCDTWTSNKNKRDIQYSFYGVSRHIPESIKKQVREECGYGCVFDGNMLVQYDHFEPEFVDVRYEHSSKGMALLCWNCHGRKKGKSPEITNEMVKKAKLDPFSKRFGTVKYPRLFVPPGPQQLKMGDIILSGGDLRINVGSHPVLRIQPQLDIHGPVTIDAHLKTQSGATLLRLERNELTADPVPGFDCQSSGSNLRFLENGNTFLELDRSQNDTMTILSADFWFLNHHFRINDQGLFVDEKAKIAGGRFEIHATGNFNINV